MRATQIKTCSQCPLARLIEGDRYVCTASETSSDTVRGHWEVTRASCRDAIAQLATSDTLETSPVETPNPNQELPRTPKPKIRHSPSAAIFDKCECAKCKPPAELPKPTKLSKHPFAYDWSVFKGQHSFSSASYGKCECYDCKPPEAPKVEPDPQPFPPSKAELEVLPLSETKKFDPNQADIEIIKSRPPVDVSVVKVTPFRTDRKVPVSKVQSFAKVPDHYINRIKGADTVRADTLLAFMRIWGATSQKAKDIVDTVNWLLGAPSFDMTNTLLVESLIGIQRPVPANNQSYFGVDLKVGIKPEPEDYHDKY
jgi:hypothetical protein